MNIDDVVEMTISDFFHMAETDGGIYQVEAPDGWADINIMIHNHDKECCLVTLENELALECSLTHRMFTHHGWKHAKDLNVGDFVLTRDGFVGVMSVMHIGFYDTFDFNLANLTNSYYSNSIVSHNCGKSLISKAISSMLGMPLLRLDVGSLFGRLMGQSEDNARAVIRLIEAVCPAIVWIEEIEKGMAGIQSSGSTDSGTAARVFGTLLVWLQEKKSQAMVVATANKISSLPPSPVIFFPFDEIFFVDLPTVEERAEIFSIHIIAKGRNPDNFDLQTLALASDGFSGAEIEGVVVSALFDAFYEKRDITTADLLNSIHRTVPLSRTMADEINELREWAKSGRAVMASNSELTTYNKKPAPLDSLVSQDSLDALFT